MTSSFEGGGDDGQTETLQGITVNCIGLKSGRCTQFFIITIVGDDLP